MSVKIVLAVNLVLGLFSVGVGVHIYRKVDRFETGWRELEKFHVVVDQNVNIPKWIPTWARWTWVQTYHTEVRKVVILTDGKTGQPFFDDSLRVVARIPGIESLTLSNTRVTDQGLADLEIANLKTIWLNGTKVTDQGVRSLEKKYSQLENLSLHNTQVTSATTKLAGSFSKLKRLHLGTCSVTDDEIRSIQSLPLRYLDVQSPLLTDEGFAVIAQLPELINLHVDVTQISPQALDSLATKKVVSLSTVFSSGSIDDYTGPISAAASLNYLAFKGGRLGAKGTEDLLRLPNLGSLDLKRVQISEGAVEQIALQKNLTSLTLRETNFTDADLKALLPLANQLTYLYVENCDLTDAGLAELRNFTSLQELTLAGDRLTSRGIIHFESMTWLTSLTIESTQVTDECVSSLTKMTGLKMLSVAKTAMTKTGGLALEKGLPTTSVDYQEKPGRLAPVIRFMPK